MPVSFLFVCYTPPLYVSGTSGRDEWLSYHQLEVNVDSMVVGDIESDAPTWMIVGLIEW